MLRRRAHSRIGLVLGGGAARGWAHIGAIRALHDAGIKPDVVCGTSIGALVAAVYANGDLDWLEDWVSRRWCACSTCAFPAACWVDAR
jgi:NTE family protein